MTILMTGRNNILAYWNDTRPVQGVAVFAPQNRLRLEIKRSFARFSAFADNSNHAPTGQDGAVTSERGVNLLFRIAGAR